jgi:phage gp29-like protein
VECGTARRDSLSFSPGTLLDWTGTPIVRDARPPAERIAETVGVREPWSSRVIREVTPEIVARVLSPNCELSDRMAFCKRIGRDDHIFSVSRTMKLSISGLHWEVLPFDDSPIAEEIRAFVEAVLRGFPRFSQMLVKLLDGLVKPLAGVEIIWNPKTWLPVGFIAIDPVRWTWSRQANALQLRTIRAPLGESLTPNGFIVHRADDEPLWEKLAWLFSFKRFAYAEWVRFGELFGKPFRIAFYQDKNDKEAILEAVRELGVNAAGVFPEGTEIRLEEAQRYGSVNLYQSLKRECEEGISKVVLGHALNADARTGSGLQAGNAAKDVSDDNRKAYAVGVADTLRDAFIRPLVGWHYGWQYEAQLPFLKFAFEPPEDLLGTAETLKIASDLLAASGEAIDPEFIRQKFGITKTVRRVSVPAPAAKQPPAADAGGTPTDQTQARRDLVEIEPGVFIASGTSPVIRTLDDVHAVASRLAVRAVGEITAAVRAKAAAAQSVESFIDDLFESYDEMPTTKAAAILRDATAASHEIGRASAQ